MLGESDHPDDDLGADDTLEHPDATNPGDEDPATGAGAAEDADSLDPVDGPDDMVDEDAEDEGLDRVSDPAVAEVAYEPVDATPDVPTPPETGDETVDDALLRLAQSQAGSFAERIEAGEHAHRSLQSRLGGLGGA